MDTTLITNLRLENWHQITPEERLQALQDLENEQAREQGREAYRVYFLDENENQKKHGTFVSSQPEFRFPNSAEPGIYIHPSIVNSQQPYKAVETLLHESRHAYQAHCASNPERAKENEPVEDWKTNLTWDGYVHPKKHSWLNYRWQPVEKDSYEFARNSTRQLYQEQFRDQSEYPTHEDERQGKISEDIQRAILTCLRGEDYIEEAKKYAQRLYQKAQLEKAQKNSPGQNDDQEYDYSYGYGY